MIKKVYGDVPKIPFITNERIREMVTVPEVYVRLSSIRWTYSYTHLDEICDMIQYWYIMENAWGYWYEHREYYEKGTVESMLEHDGEEAVRLLKLNKK
jgi:hypothetical protein